MPNYTENHDYQLFADQEDPWEHRTDFEALDTDVEIRDADSNRTQYTPKPGAKFLATDTGTRYIGDGSSWNELAYPTDGGGGGDVEWQDDGTAQATSTTANFRNNLSVSEGAGGEAIVDAIVSGASGDGLYATPDGFTFADINTALSNNHAVALPPGVYSGDTTIDIQATEDRNPFLIGYGAKLEYTGADAAIRIHGNQNPEAGWNGAFLIGFDLVGPGQGTATGIEVVDSFRNTINQCFISSFEYGIELRNEGSWSEGTRIVNTEGGGCDRWLKFTPASETGGGGTGSFRYTTVKGGWFDVAGDYGIEMSQDCSVYNSTFENIDFEEDSPECAGIYIAGSLAGTAFRSIRIEGRSDYNSTCLEFGNITAGAAEVSGITAIGGGMTRYRNPGNYYGSGIRVLGSVDTD